MKERPIYLNLFTFRFPITAIVSFMHRLSGIYLFLMIPVFLWILQESIKSQANFEQLKMHLSPIWVQIVLWLAAAALIFHFVAGIRHMLMDIHIAETLKGGRIGAWLVLAIFVFLIFICGGVWIWSE